MNYISKLLLLFLFSAIIIVFNSCIKEEPEKLYIITGDSSGMLITNYDQTLVFTSPEYSIDINNDGIDDIAFEKELTGSANLGHDLIVFFKPLHENAELLGYNTIDTLVVSFDTVFTDHEEGVTATITCTYQCSLCCETYDSIRSLEPTFVLSYLQKGVTISNSNEFSNEKILLKDFSYSFSYYDGVQNDTSYFYRIVSINDCHNYPPNNIIYICVRLNKCKLGWIKVIISEDLTINLLETAIQL